MESVVKKLPEFIQIQFIHQKDHRYETVGDYGTTTDGNWWFKITDMQNPVYSMAILIHELWEKTRNSQLDISDEAVDNFDISHPELDDPGLSLDAPYHKTHMESDALERACIAMGGEDWVEYEAVIEEKIKWKG
jgi:hypothetical protein